MSIKWFITLTVLACVFLIAALLVDHESTEQFALFAVELSLLGVLTIKGIK